MFKNLSRRKMQEGGGGDPKILKKKFELKIFFGKFFFEFKKLIHIVEKVSEKSNCYATRY